MSAPAQRSMQEIARESAINILNGLAVEKHEPTIFCLQSVILRAIAEAVKTVDARIESSARNDLHEASRIVRASASGPNFANTFCLANRISFIADALDELGRAE